jgi:mannitol/fructose-specific phosphotransferase system IIA component (Ntr-type)
MLDVPVVFMLALKDFKQQTAVIRDLMLLIQSGETIQSIHAAKSSATIYDLIRSGKNESGL